MQTYDVAIIGLGAMGSASLWHIANTGARVIGIDRCTRRMAMAPPMGKPA